MDQQDRFITRIQDALDRYKDGLSFEGDRASEEFHVGMELCDTIGNDEAKMQSLARMREILLRLTETCTGIGPTSECPLLEALDHYGTD